MNDETKSNVLLGYFFILLITIMMIGALYSKHLEIQKIKASSKTVVCFAAKGEMKCINVTPQQKENNEPK